MATLRDIKQRIKGVQNTQQITKAMKMVAAAKLRRAQEGVVSARPYARKINETLSRLVAGDSIISNRFLSEREVKKAAVVVVTADRGLCGAFNANILKESVRYVEEELAPQNIEPVIYCVGKKGFDFYKNSSYQKVGSNLGLFSSLHYDSALSISNDLIKGYLHGEYDKVVIIYNEFKSIIQQKIVVEQFLPIPFIAANQKGKTETNYIYEPNQIYIFEYLLPKHLKAQMWRVLLESNASEFGARMTAMDNATTNASELIRTLRLKFNRERQAAITKEILEIVTGANALRAGN